MREDRGGRRRCPCPPFRRPSSIRSLSSRDNVENIKADRVAKQFWLLICFLRVFGFYPIEKAPDPPLTDNVEPEDEHEDEEPPLPSTIMEEKQVRRFPPFKRKRKPRMYKACYRNWKAKIAMYSYLMTTFNFFCWIIYIFNIGIGIPFPMDLARLEDEDHQDPGRHKKNNESLSLEEEHTENRVVILGEGIIKFLEMFHLIVNASLFTDWLNNWQDFERDFRKYFGQKGILFHYDIRAFRAGFLIFYSLLPSLVRLALSTFATLHYWHNPRYLVLSYFVFLWIDILLVVHSLLEDSKTFLMLRSLQMVLEQIRLAINEVSQTGQRIAVEDVTEWRKLVHLSRKQVTLCSDYIKGRQLLILVDTIFVFSEGLFTLLEAYKNGHVPTFVIISKVLLCSLCYVRLYLTVLLAERIYSEEAQMSKDILEIPTEGLEDATKLELKFLHSMMSHTPATINLGNYVNVDKKLVITIGFYVLVVLIAILEYNGASLHRYNHLSK